MHRINIVHEKEACCRNATADDCLILPYHLRQKARQRVTLSSGREVGLMLPRSTTLNHGDIMAADDGTRFKVVAAEEEVSIAEVGDPLKLAKIAYHLGNRHVAVQVLKDRLIYLHDHVLDDMVCRLGATVTICRQSFEPEEGAYHGGGHHHH